MDIAQLSADPELVEKGKWFKFEGDVEFLIAFSENDKYRKKYRKALMKSRLARGSRDLPDVTDEANVEALYGTVVLGWKGLTQNGEPFEFNLKNLKTLCAQPNGVLNFILTESGLKANFQDEEEEAPLKKGELTADKAELKSGAGVGVGVVGQS